jgi:hypothetical protein
VSSQARHCGVVVCPQHGTQVCLAAVRVAASADVEAGGMMRGEHPGEARGGVTALHDAANRQLSTLLNRQEEVAGVQPPSVHREIQGPRWFCNKGQGRLETRASDPANARANILTQRTRGRVNRSGNSSKQSTW